MSEMDEPDGPHTPALADQRDDGLVQSLRATLAKMEIALGALDEPLLFVDVHGRIEWCNAPFAELIGRSKLGVLGSDLADVLQLQREGTLLSGSEHPVAKVIGEGQSVSGVYELRLAERANRLVRLTGHCVSHDTMEGQGVFAVRDVTMSQRQLRRDQLAALGSLTRGMLHQINSPLAALRSGVEYLRAELLEGRDDPKTFIELLDDSLEAVDHISALFRSVSGFGDSDSDRFELFDVAHSVETAARISRGHWDTVAEVEILPARGETDVYGNPSSITQALAQLFANAAWAVSERASCESQLETTFRGRITITMQAMGDWTQLEVSDNGVGIPASIRNDIFTPFFTTRNGTEATGQGLYVARSIIEDLHGGTLKLGHSPRGAKFVVRLPAFARE